MNTEQIMYMVYDYADAFHNRVDSIGEVDTPTQKELKHSQMEIGKQIKTAIKQVVNERDAAYERAAKTVESYCGAWDDNGFALATAIRALKEQA